MPAAGKVLLERISLLGREFLREIVVQEIDYFAAGHDGGLSQNLPQFF
jgi:hypothetical protein